MDVKNFISPLLKWWWLIIISAILAGVTSYLAVRNEPDIYRARATLMIGRPFDDPNPQGGQFYLSQQLATTYADIANREPVRQAAATALGIDSLPYYEVTVPPQTQLIDIAVQHANPSFAQAVANEIAHQLVQLSPGAEDPDRKEQSEFIESQLVKLSGQIEETQAEILSLQTQLGEISSARDIAQTQEQIAALQDKLSTLQTNYTSFLANSQSEATNVLSIVESAPLPRSPIGPNKGQAVILSMALGVVLAASAAYVLEYLDDSLRTEEDIERAVGLHVLASLPKINGSSQAQPLLTLKSPRSSYAEAMRELRTRVLFLNLNKDARILLITSANIGEGKSYTSSNLAVVLAQAGYKTILVDADLRLPSQHEIFELRNVRGLSTAIIGANLPEQSRRGTMEKPLDELLESVIQDTMQSGLDIMTSGPIPPNPSELVGSNGMVRILDALRTKYDYIILDSAPALVVTDTVLLSSRADAVVVVSSGEQMRSKTLKKVVGKLLEMNANVAGVVVNSDPKVNQRSYAYYQPEVEEEPAGDQSSRSSRSANGNGLREKFGKLVAGDSSDHKQGSVEQP